MALKAVKKSPGLELRLIGDYNMLQLIVKLSNKRASKETVLLKWANCV